MCADDRSPSAIRASRSKRQSGNAVVHSCAMAWVPAGSQGTTPPPIRKPAPSAMRSSKRSKSRPFQASTKDRTTALAASALGARSAAVVIMLASLSAAAPAVSVTGQMRSGLGRSSRTSLAGPVHLPYVEADRDLRRASWVTLACAGDVPGPGGPARAVTGRRCTRPLSGFSATAPTRLDAVQDTFVIALLRLGELRQARGRRAWLHTVLRNVCLACESGSRREVPGRRHCAWQTPCCRAPPPCPGPEEALDRHVMRDWVWQALGTAERGRAADRHAAPLHPVHQLRGDRPGHRGPVGTVRSRLNRARARLAGTLLAAADGQRRSGHARAEAAHAPAVDRVLPRGARPARAARPTGSCSRPTSRSATRPGIGTGFGAWSAEERAAISVGVRATIIDVLASRDITILEVDFSQPCRMARPLPAARHLRAPSRPRPVPPAPDPLPRGRLAARRVGPGWYECRHGSQPDRPARGRGWAARRGRGAPAGAGRAAGAVLRDDQWTAIEALVVDAAAGAGRAAHRLGQVGGLLRRHRAAARRGAGPTVIVSPLLALMRNQIEAAERAGIRAAHDQLGQHRRVGRRSTPQIAAGEVDVLLVSPERLNNPDFRDEVLPALAADARACSWSTRRTASPTGATTSGPTTAGSARCSPSCRRASRCWPPPPPPTPGSPPTSPSSWASATRTTLVLRGSLDRESLRLAWCGCPPPEQRLAWLAEHLAELPGSGIVYSLTVAAAQEVAGYLRDRGHDVAAYSGQTEAAERAGRGGRLLANRVKALVATSALGHGLRQARPRASSSTSARRRRRSPTTSRSAAPAAASTRAEVVLLPGREDRDIWAYFASLAFPPEQLVRRRWRRWPRPAARCPPPRWRPQVDLSRAGSRRCSRSSTSTARSAGSRAAGQATGRAVGLRRGALRAGRRGARARAAGDARLPRPPPSAGWRSCASQLDDPGRRALRPLRQLHRAALVRERSSDAGAGGGARPAGAARRGRRAAQDVADRAGRTSASTWPGRSGHGGRRAGRAVARLTDLGWGPRLRALLEAGPRTARGRTGREPVPATSRPRTSWSRPWSRCWPRGTGRSGRPGWSPCRPAATRS